MCKYVMLVLFLSVALMVGCTPPGPPLTGSGKVVPQEEAISGFDKVKVSHAFKAEISQGETFSVVVRVDDNLVEYLDVVEYEVELETRDAEAGREYLEAAMAHLGVKAWREREPKTGRLFRRLGPARSG